MKYKVIFAIIIICSIFLLFFVKSKKQTKISTSDTTNNDKNWRDDFNKLDNTFWKVADREALEGRYTNHNIGYFKKDHVWVKKGFLVLKLTQENGQVDDNPKGVISKGSEIESFKNFGYGIYQWRMRTSSTSDDPKNTGKTVSGQISAGFNFINNSQTEIDFEVQGQYPQRLEMTAWENPDTSRFPTADDRVYTYKTIKNMATEFHIYKFVWTKEEIKYYVVDVLVADHQEHISGTPAHFMINHWGTDSTNFGGEATIGVNRYMLIDWVSFTAV
jgi:endo-1,3-1,4-beta-glycanase ExoK